MEGCVHRATVSGVHVSKVVVERGGVLFVLLTGIDPRGHPLQLNGNRVANESHTIQERVNSREKNAFNC